MAQSKQGGKQSTFGEIAVNHYSGDRRCDYCLGIGENGEPKRCTNSASIVILRGNVGVAEFFCKMHTMDTWEEMANDGE